ncbi:histidine--tRNA ligase [Methyloraptor flagellatus]|uniref:Histidine--tRNA ligase n=1 Tax=Methyloraptor flagellatus TaxID=3162530 RepID=A0AAU7X671_9HYPH
MASVDRLKARLPRGFVDRAPHEIKTAEKMLAVIRETYELYGFEPVETPLVEYTDALGKFLPDQDRPNEGVFSFQDDDEQWLSLRYDLTAPLARYVAENYERLPKPYRSYRAGWVFRNEKPGPGRFRQFMQFDADTVGAPSVAADAEICMMAADTLEKLGLKRGDFVVKVNNRKVLDGLMEAIGLGGDEHAKTRLAVFRAIDKLDKFGTDGVFKLLREGRLDESGDFTKGAGLSDDAANKVLSFVGGVGEAWSSRKNPDAPGDDEFIGYHDPQRLAAPVSWNPPGAVMYYDTDLLLDNWEAIVGSTQAGREGISELRDIVRLTRASGYGSKRIRISAETIRGLEYYTGPVYEAELTFEVPNEDGQIVRFGSVAGGGRYDGLVSRFLGESVPATGFSIGVSRLLSALKLKGLLGASEEVGPVVVLVMDKSEIGRYQAMVATLRAAGIRSELYLGGSGMKAQMKYADRRNAPCVIIQGSDERTQGVVQLKDLIEGKRLAAGITDNKEWRESRPAQVTVPEMELVAAVTEILGRHR